MVAASYGVGAPTRVSVRPGESNKLRRPDSGMCNARHTVPPRCVDVGRPGILRACGVDDRRTVTLGLGWAACMPGYLH